MNDKNKKCIEFCTGCGLCVGKKYADPIQSENGFHYPDPRNDNFKDFCDNVCPSLNTLKNNVNPKSVWGSYKLFYESYSSNPIIRRRASSGGCLTSICLWLLQNKKVDGIIQTMVDEDNPIKTITVVSSTEEDVIKCAGSRYSESSPLLSIDSLVESGKKYAFVGKPCDVYSLNKYLEMNVALKSQILYKFSFFCAGTPSTKANDKLIKELGIAGKLQYLSYRGDGWPGFTKAYDESEIVKSMSYQHAWMDILGRDIRLGCKFCFDSIGECSDLSFGDFWYLNNNEPDFTEREGRNCLFAWSELGVELLQEIVSDGILIVKDANINELKFSQPNHFNRRATMLSKLIVMKLCGRRIPRYNFITLLRYAKFTSLRNHYRASKGTFKRLKDGTLK